jgi:hypothetical protein
MRSWMSAVVACAIAAGCSATPTSTPVPTSMTTARPTAVPTATHALSATSAPSASISPSPTALAREIDGTLFTKRGGCGDAFLWAATADDANAITVEWPGAASEAWADDGFDEAADLPTGRVRVALVTGHELSTIYCNDILSPDAGADTEVAAVSGQVALVVRPDAGGFRPAGHADLTVSGVTFEVTIGTESEMWRLESLEWHDELVGWFAG